MAKHLITILNVATGEFQERQMTNEELVQYEKDQVDAQTEAEAALQAANKKLAAEAKLAALGLTADDLAALGL
jgi:phosphoglycerate-specific signal transduction histidine kinase